MTSHMLYVNTKNLIQIEFKFVHVHVLYKHLHKGTIGLIHLLF